jgi:hypothetical protein
MHGKNTLSSVDIIYCGPPSTKFKEISAESSELKHTKIDMTCPHAFFVRHTDNVSHLVNLSVAGITAL